MFVVLSYLELTLLLVSVFAAGFILSEVLNRKMTDHAVRQEKLRQEVNTGIVLPTTPKENDVFVTEGAILIYKNNKWALEE